MHLSREQFPLRENTTAVMSLKLIFAVIEVKET